MLVKKVSDIILHVKSVESGGAQIMHLDGINGGLFTGIKIIPVVLQIITVMKFGFFHRQIDFDSIDKNWDHFFLFFAQQ